jgi:hypothetical protein
MSWQTEWAKPQPEDDGVPDVPDVEVENPHWKVGDGMNDSQGKPGYIIGQIAVVNTGKNAEDKTKFDIVFFNTKGIEIGRLHLVEQ